MIALAIIVVALPLTPALAAALTPRARPLGMVAAASGVATLGVAIALAIHVSGSRPVTALSGFIYLDPLSGFFLATIAVVVALASIGSAAYMRAEEHRGELSGLQVRLYFISFAIFAAMMLASFETGNLGLLWVLIEASTLASCVLVGLEGKPVSLEAAWKYIIISSFGVTIALVGTLFLYYAAGNLGGSPTQHLTWSYLFAHAGGLSAQSLRLAFLLALIGYGTKVGLAPMHTWLPDAHSQAPAPVCAMLSGAELNCAMLAIVRVLSLASPSAGARAGDLHAALLGFGLLSMTVGVVFLISQRNFKRLLAYSSVEQMGLIAAGFGIGAPLAVVGALLQMFTHSLAKSLMFFNAGNLLLRFRTTTIAEVRGVVRLAPVTAVLLIAGALAIAGAPPFGLFVSEFSIVRSALGQPNWGAGALIAALLLVGFIALVAPFSRMAFGEGDAPSAQPRAELELGVLAPGFALLAAVLVLGFWIPGPLHALLIGASHVVAR